MHKKPPPKILYYYINLTLDFQVNEERQKPIKNIGKKAIRANKIYVKKCKNRIENRIAL